MSVFVLGRHHQPVMPCSEKCARLLLARQQAVVHGRTPEGERHQARHLAELTHRALLTRAGYRRPRGWLALSLRSRVGNVLRWARCSQRWGPLSRLEVEHMRCDTQGLHQPEINGAAYQRRTLLRAYVHAKCRYRCTSYGSFELQLERPISRGGSDRVSNLALSGHACHQAQMPLTDATRWRLVEDLRSLGLPVGSCAVRAIAATDRANVTASGCAPGDLVLATVPPPRKTRGVHIGRVVVRACGFFRLGAIDGITARYCRMLQRADGYAYAQREGAGVASLSHSYKERLPASHG